MCECVLLVRKISSFECFATFCKLSTPPRRGTQPAIHHLHIDIYGSETPENSRGTTVLRVVQSLSVVVIRRVYRCELEKLGLLRWYGETVGWGEFDYLLNVLLFFNFPKK